MPNPLENPQPVGSHVILAEHMLRAALHLVEDLQPRYNELNKQRVQFGGSPLFALPILVEMTSLLEQLGGRRSSPKPLATLLTSTPSPKTNSHVPRVLRAGGAA